MALRVQVAFWLHEILPWISLQSIRSYAICWIMFVNEHFLTHRFFDSRKPFMLTVEDPQVRNILHCEKIFIGLTLLIAFTPLGRLHQVILRKAHSIFRRYDPEIFV